MFEIGNSLREARLRQGLDFAEIEQATKIRGKYLRSLEEERFDVLPGQTYVKGFLRSYAEYLGLDGQLYVDEFNSRYVRFEEEAPLAARSPIGLAASRPRLESRLVVIALFAIGIVTALVIAAWKFGAPEQETAIPNLPERRVTTQQQQRPRTTPKRPVVRVARVLFTAARGNCWLEVHRGSPSGRLVFQGTLEQSQRQMFAAPRLWIVAGQPAALTVRVNGRLRSLPSDRSGAAFVITPAGVRLAAPA